MYKPSLWALCVAVSLVTPSIAFAGGTYHHAEWVPTKSTDAVVESEHPVKHHLLRLASRSMKQIAAHKRLGRELATAAEQADVRRRLELPICAAGRDQTP